MTPITGIHRQYHVAKLCELQTIKDRAIVRWGDTDAVGMRILAAKKLNMEKQKLWYT